MKTYYLKKIFQILKGFDEKKCERELSILSGMSGTIID